jgi:ubiquinone/menaquinone biosynthesis C-methylase UbiE
MSITFRRAIRIIFGLVAVVAVLVIAGAAFANWRGFGFHDDGPELTRLREILALEPGMSVADVGAGNGELAMALAAEVGHSGRVYATDLDPKNLQQVSASAAAAGLATITVVQGEVADTKLPENCCDAIVVRRVYHHLTDAPAINRSLLRALRPGGRLAVIDFPPFVSWLWPLDHGVDATRVIDEVVASSFQLVEVIDNWPGRGPLSSYCTVFTRRGDELNR